MQDKPYITWITRDTVILAGFVVVKFVLHTLLISPEYELHRDEYLHLDQANHPAWGYVSVPPFTSWVSTVIQWLGNSVVWIKFFPTLFGALTMVAIWKAVESLGGGLFARLLAATGILFSSILRVNTLYQPNSFDVLSWTTFYYTLIRYLRTENTKWLYVGGLVLALGFLNKYNIIFLLIGILPALLITPQQRLFATRSFWLAAALALLLVSSNLIWQFNNGFPVVKHLRELSETQLVHVDFWDFLHSQLFYFIGSLAVLLGSAYALWAYQPFGIYRVFFWTFFFTLAVFIAFKAKAYYAIGLYPIYLAFGATYLEKLLDKGWKRFLRPVLLLLPVLFFIPAYQIGFPNRPPEYILAHQEDYRDLGMLRWEDGKDYELPQDYADMLGWKELARMVDSAYARVPDPAATIVLCDNYGQAGAINYYSALGVRAVSFSADYLHWMILDRPYRHFIRVKEHNEVQDEFAKTSRYFEQAERYGAVTNRFAREYGTTVLVFTNAKVDINARLRAEQAHLR